MKKKRQAPPAAEPDPPTSFHVRVKPSTAEWLRDQVNRDATSVPAVIRDIVEDRRRKEKQPTN